MKYEVTYTMTTPRKMKSKVHIFEVDPKQRNVFILHIDPYQTIRVTVEAEASQRELALLDRLDRDYDTWYQTEAKKAAVEKTTPRTVFHKLIDQERQALKGRIEE